MKAIHTLILFLSLLLLQFSSSGQSIVFKNVFAPTDAFVKPQERPYRDAICLNGSWKFMPVNDTHNMSEQTVRNPYIPDSFSWDNVPVKIPSPWNVNSFAEGNGGDFTTYPTYPKTWEKVRAGWLMRKIGYQKSWKNKRLILHFEAVAGFSKIYLNKKKIGENFDLFLPFEIDITDMVKEGEDNELLVWVADAELFNKPGKYGERTHVGGSFWGKHAIGIWQDVYVVAKPSIHVQNTFIKPFVDRDELEVEVLVRNESSKAQDIMVSGTIMPWVNKSGKGTLEAAEPNWDLGEVLVALPREKIRIQPGASQTVNFKIKVNGKLKLWSADAPNLYGLILSLNNGNSIIDKHYNRFGWREFSIINDKFFLNGKQIVLKGDSWHFMGIPQMTRRYAWAWYTMLKDCNANAVRLHAQPYPQFYLDMADEMGVYVLDETGIWASDGGPKADSEEYWKNCEDHLSRLILRDRNHPSVFGWSVCNENLPVVMHVQRAPDSLIKRQVSEINKWVSITRKLDPSRSWISGDGETNRPTDLPTVVGHYGSENEIREWSSQSKVWGIGEQGMAYSGTPRQVAKFNGKRAYESQQGRMEGLAVEAGQLLDLQKKYSASFTSVFNIVWYGLKPLELGLRNATAPPRMEDGIFYLPFKEGKPGVQPERLGPYTTTLNPGYDPGLPLYKTWPLYDIVKLSFSDTKATFKTPETQPEDKPLSRAAVNQDASVILLSADKNKTLFDMLTNLGVQLKDRFNKTDKTVLIIDGKYPVTDKSSLALQASVLQNGGSVLVWGVSPASINALNRILPHSIEITSRPATSFVKKSNGTILNGLDTPDFYFSEVSDSSVMKHGFTGDFVQKGKVLLEACNTDWKRWNHQPEFIKTASVLRSEREAKPLGNALVMNDSGPGKIYVFALEPSVLSGSSLTLLRRMFGNLGIPFKNISSKDIRAIGPSGVLENALILGSFDVSGKSLTEISRMDFLQGSNNKQFHTGAQIRDRFCEVGKADEGVFDFVKMSLTGPAEEGVVYVSFWVYSPRSLVDLLVEPDMPRLDMLVGADDAFQFFLNNKLIKESVKEGGLKRREQTVKALPLEKGWNHFMIKVIQKGGDWKLAVEFECDKKDFLREIRSGINPEL